MDLKELSELLANNPSTSAEEWLQIAVEDGEITPAKANRLLQQYTKQQAAAQSVTPATARAAEIRAADDAVREAIAPRARAAQEAFMTSRVNRGSDFNQSRAMRTIAEQLGVPVLDKADARNVTSPLGLDLDRVYQPPRGPVPPLEARSVRWNPMMPNQLVDWFTTAQNAAGAALPPGPPATIGANIPPAGSVGWIGTPAQYGSMRMAPIENAAPTPLLSAPDTPTPGLRATERAASTPRRGTGMAQGAFGRAMQQAIPAADDVLGATQFANTSSVMAPPTGLPAPTGFAAPTGLAAPTGRAVTPPGLLAAPRGFAAPTGLPRPTTPAVQPPGMLSRPMGFPAPTGPGITGTPVSLGPTRNAATAAATQAAGLTDDIAAAGGKSIWSRLGGAGRFAKAGTGLGIGLAGTGGSMLIDALWDDPNSGWDDAASGALSMAGVGAGLGAFGGPIGMAIGGAGGAILGGLQGYFGNDNNGPKAAANEITKQQGKLAEVASIYGIGQNTPEFQEMMQGINAQLAMADKLNPAMVKEVYGNVLAQAPAAFQQMKQQQTNAAKRAAIEAAIIPLMQQSEQRYLAATAEAGQGLERAAARAVDPQLAELLRSQRQALNAQAAQSSQAAYGQMAQASMLQDLLGMQPQFTTSQTTGNNADLNALIDQLLATEGR